MLQYIILWYLTTYTSTVVYKNVFQQSNGILIVQMIATWLSVIGPTLTENNTLSFMTDIVQPNAISISVSLVCLLIGGIAIGIHFDTGFEKNTVGQYLFLTVASVSGILYIVVVLIILPINIEQCSCLYGYYGETCENSCFDSNNYICSGHGTCSSTGCLCDIRFQGELCNNCINEYNYDTNCTACNQGYSLTYQCTQCTTGRDPTTNCQSCLNGYLEDEAYNSPVLGCNVCKENYFQPSPDPRVGSYNAFLEFGEVCAPCNKENGIFCNGHGTCNHFLKADAVNGDFVFDGLIVLGDQANGECECLEGFYGPSCTKGLGFDLENTESICNNNGYVQTNYKRNINDIFDTFTGISCVCEEGWSPSLTDDACSCKGISGSCTECAFGYYLTNGNCLPCPNGGFTRACNMKNAGGVCQNDGSCDCLVSYATGGYTGTSCTECVNNNFYSQGENICVPCPGANSDGFFDACNGHGVCITQKRLDTWSSNNNNLDSYSMYEFQVGSINKKTIVELEDEIGNCECFENYVLNIFGTCS